MLCALLYGSEKWVVKSSSMRQLEGFHNFCIRISLGVPRTRQWKEWIKSRELAGYFGMKGKMTEIISREFGTYGQ